MRKNKSSTYAFFFFIILVIFIILIIPGNPKAEEKTAEETTPGPLWKLLFFPLGVFLNVLEKLLNVLLKLLPVVAIATGIKIWLLKRKLSLPWKSFEKLSITTFSETVVEMSFLLFIMVFFIPAISSLLKDIGLAETVTEIGYFFKFTIYILIVIPYQAVISAILCLLLIHLSTPMNLEEIRQYFKFGALLALILPGILFIFIFIFRILFNWNYI